jgi:hypothetical protein|tara:strand:+ start:109 stop:330 length:222 start_codon:yes stop_codon:yes gene_type:complete
MARNYKKEYANYHSKSAQKKDRAMRNAARAIMKKLGKTYTGDKRDVAHKDNNPRNNSVANLKMQTRKKNRARK